MKISDMLNALNPFLETFAQQNGGGHALICSDVTKVWDALLNGPAQFTILTCWNGERTRDTNFRGPSILGRVDSRFLVVVKRARGINILRGDPLTFPTQSGPPLYDLAEGVRDICRGMQFDQTTTESPVDYDGITPFQVPQGIITDALQIEFSVGNDIGTLVNYGVVPSVEFQD